MKFSRTYALKEIADILSVDYIGADDFPVNGMNEIHVVEPGDIVFVDHPKYYDKALKSAATVVLINKKVDCPEGKALLISEDPFSDFNKLSTHFKPRQRQRNHQQWREEISPTFFSAVALIKPERHGKDAQNNEEQRPRLCDEQRHIR